MVEEAATAHKEVLAWLKRASQLAGQALRNLNSGNPYDAVHLIKVIAKVDANVLNVITRVPNYETHVKQAHLELISECRAVLALSQQALQTVSPELRTWPPEKLAKARQTFQEALTELGKELKAEEEVKYWFSEAEKAFGQSKAWTYSRLGLEHALGTLDFLVKDENAIKQTMGRYSTLFRGVKHPNPNQFLQDLLKRRLRVRAAAKYVLDNAFKDGFAFELNEHTWHSMLNEVSHLPEENVRELNALKEQLLQSTIFAKRNVSYPKLSQVLNRLVGLGKHTIIVERAIEAAEAAVPQQQATAGSVLTFELVVNEPELSRELRLPNSDLLGFITNHFVKGDLLTLIATQKLSKDFLKFAFWWREHSGNSLFRGVPGSSSGLIMKFGNDKTIENSSSLEISQLQRFGLRPSDIVYADPTVNKAWEFIRSRPERPAILLVYDAGKLERVADFSFTYKLRPGYHSFLQALKAIALVYM